MAAFRIQIKPMSIVEITRIVIIYIIILVLLWSSSFDIYMRFFK